MKNRRRNPYDREVRQLPLDEYQFVNNELIKYYNRAYGNKVNGSPFTVHDINNWSLIGKVPEVYGNNKMRQIEMSGLVVYEVEGLSREDVYFVLNNKSFNLEKKLHTKVKRKPPRTRLYYQLLKKDPPSNVLPDNWKEIGIKPNQIKIYKRKKKK